MFVAHPARISAPTSGESGEARRDREAVRGLDMAWARGEVGASYTRRRHPGALSPLLHIGPATNLTPSVYPPLSLTWLDPGVPWPDNPLTWPTVPEQDSVVVPGDPDPAEVD
jgi:hypothetical protein